MSEAEAHQRRWWRRRQRESEPLGKPPREAREHQPGAAEKDFASAPSPPGAPAKAARPPEPLRPPPAVAAQDVVKRFGSGDAEVQALRGVTVSIGAGTFTAVMGPSGSGKSTLMHILAGLDTASEGTVQITGQPLEELGDRELTRLRRRQVGFVFQAFNLLPVLSAEENLRLPLTIAGIDGDPEWIEMLLEKVALSDRRRHRPAQLSGGQQQRLAIARALVTRPAVVFADEPTGNLDSAASEEVLEMLREAVDDLDQTVVMVTHEATAAARADRVLFLADGRLVADEAGLSADAILDTLKRH